MMIEKFDPGDEESFERSYQHLRPDHIDLQIRSVIQPAWMILPKEKRTVDDVERHIRRVVDRAFRDMREDLKEFFGRDTVG